MHPSGTLKTVRCWSPGRPLSWGEVLANGDRCPAGSNETNGCRAVLSSARQLQIVPYVTIGSAGELTFSVGSIPYRRPPRAVSTATKLCCGATHSAWREQIVLLLGNHIGDSPVSCITAADIADRDFASIAEPEA